MKKAVTTDLNNNPENLKLTDKLMTKNNTNFAKICVTRFPQSISLVLTSKHSLFF